MGFIDEVGAALTKIAETTGPAVVGIGNRRGAGSGVVVGPGRVLTNAHNLHRNEVRVTLAGGSGVEGGLAGADIDADIAVIEVDTGDAPVIEWGDPAGLGIGSGVFALSNPGGRGLRVTFGFVSGTERTFRGPRGRRIGGSLEHTAPLLPGSSGGPVVDSDGRLLGINTNRLGEGFYLAIPADAALTRQVESLGRGEQPRRPRLGVGIAPSYVARRLRRAVGLPDADGILVRAVEEDGPGAAAGLREGDLIVSASGKPLSKADDLYEVLDGLSDGSLDLELLRGVERLTLTVNLAA